MTPSKTEQIAHHERCTKTIPILSPPQSLSVRGNHADIGIIIPRAILQHNGILATEVPTHDINPNAVPGPRSSPNSSEWPATSRRCAQPPCPFHFGIMSANCRPVYWTVRTLSPTACVAIPTACTTYPPGMSFASENSCMGSRNDMPGSPLPHGFYTRNL